MYFFWISSLNFSEFAELIAISTLDRTPIIYIQCVFGFVIVYLTCKDLEVIGRVSELLMPFVVLALTTLYIFITISGQLNLKELQPILANGIKPVLKEVYPTFSTFPYGEDVVFLMYYCYVNSKESIRKVAFYAIFALGILLIISTIVIVSVLGVDLASNTTIPLLDAIKLINIGDTIQNIDALGVIVMFIGGLFKAMLFFYGSVLGIYSLFKFNRIVLIIIMNILLIWFNLSAIPNFIFHRFAGISFTNSYLHEIYTIFIPLLLVIISWLKNLNKTNKIR
jgi:spore germination protein KB